MQRSNFDPALLQGSAEEDMLAKTRQCEDKARTMQDMLAKQASANSAVLAAEGMQTPPQVSATEPGGPAVQCEQASEEAISLNTSSASPRSATPRSPEVPVAMRPEPVSVPSFTEEPPPSTASGEVLSYESVPEESTTDAGWRTRSSSADRGKQQIFENQPKTPTADACAGRVRTPLGNSNSIFINGNTPSFFENNPRKSQADETHSQSCMQK